MADAKRPSERTRKQVCLGIMESIAAEKAALARLMSVEADKVEKIVCLLYASPNDLLAVNQSVESTLGALVKIEDAITEQLEWIDYELGEES